MRTEIRNRKSCDRAMINRDVPGRQTFAGCSGVDMTISKES